MRPEKIPIQFTEKDSLIHRIHPVIKLFWMLIISTLVMINQNFILNIIFLILIIFLFSLSGFRVFRIHGIKIVVVTSLFIAALQLFFNSNGQQMISFCGIAITSNGIEKAIYLSTRFCSIIFVGFLFILTTNPNTLVHAFMRAGISYRLGFTFISAIRLMTIFSRESEKIYFSSIIKGYSYKIFPINRFYKNLTNYFRLLIVSIFEKVDALVISMEGRGFGNKNKRTFMYFQPIKLADQILALIGVLVLSGNIILKIIK